MKRTQEQRQDSASTRTEVNNKLQIKENNHLFNYIEKLAADHDVYVSNTMIKVTYKKALMDQNASDGAVSVGSEKVHNKNMNHSDVGRKKKTAVKDMDLCSSDISFIAKSPKIQRGGKATAYHSTPKPQALGSEKKKKYVNGVSLSPKPNNENKKNSPIKVQKGFSIQEDDASSPKKSKAVVKPEVNKRFLMGNVSLVKAKGSVVRKKGAEANQVRLNKMDNSKKLKKLEKGVKRKNEVKRKASDVDLSLLTKKIKLSENKMKKVEGGGKFEVRYKLGSGKKPIMLVDPDLPTGWTRYIRTKNKGSENEQYVVYIVNPQGKKFRFKWKLRKYLEKTNSSLDVDRFFFGLYHRQKPSTSSAVNNEDEKTTNNSEGKSSNGFKTHRSSRQDEGSSSDTGKGSEGKELLLFDPDLPFGWKRVIHSNDSNGKKQVHIISPDGKIFRRRYRLSEYLMKHQYTHNLDRFYFGLYPKKEGNSSETSSKEGRESAKKNDDFTKTNGSAMVGSELENDEDELKDKSNRDVSESPMYDDPNLPKGWKRFIKIRTCGESAGRMEVVIVSPDGRRHRSKKHLEHYLLQNELAYKVEDFDFHVFGKKRSESGQESARVPGSEGEPEPEPEPEPDLSFMSGKKKFTDKPVPELDISSLKEIKISPEGHMINEVNGLMLSCGLSSPRNVRRQRLPRGKHENQLKSYLSSEDAVSCDGCDIPTYWIQRLVKCRGDFRNLEPDAVSTVGEATKNFLRKMSFLAFSISKESGGGTLRYEDVAELVHTTKSLSPLQTLIPRKITYKEYVKLNRPKQFLSFT